MSTNGANTADEADMMECDGEKVVTMMDVLKEQQEFEEDANAVLGGSDDKNCTYPKGYIKRQAIYVCMTCSDAREDSSKRAGICLACSLNCHENHELVELYTKRNFRCDCGNPKFNSHPCQFTPNKTDLNVENKYNQNFSGLYCICHRPYPDPESPSEDDMIQCIICEDWLHSSHLDAIAPANEQYSEMICKECMEKNNFLHDYGDLAVFADNAYGNVTNITNDLDETDVNISEAEHGDINEVQNATITSKQDDSIRFNNHDLNHTNQSEKTPNRFTSKEESQDDLTKDSTDVQIEEKNVNEGIDSTINSETISEKSIDTIINNLSANDKTEVDVSESTLTNKEDNSIAVDLNSNKETEINIENKTEDHNDNEMVDDHKKITDTVNDETNIQLDISLEKPDNSNSELAKDDDYKVSEKDENELLRDENMDDITEKKLSPQKITDDMEKEEENKEQTHSPVKNNDNETTSNNESISNDLESKVTDNVNSCDDKIYQEGVVSNKADNGIETENNLDAPTDIERGKKVTNETTVGSDDKVNVEVPTENGDNLKEQLNLVEETMDISKNVELNNSSNVYASDKENCVENTSGSNENKRKHINNEESVAIKKPKLSDTNCIRPQGVKRIFKGATFWPHNFRQKLCTCNECLSMYKDLSVLFLIDPEDTVSAYEHLGKEKSNGATPSQYEKGLEALSSLDRVQQINALTEYNKMRDKLLDFLKSFKDRNEVVKEEDIKAFFAGMKPKREPDGVYFCR